MATERRYSTDAVSVDEALAWVAEMFEEPKENIRENTPRDDIAAWDSLGQLVLMAKLDERFGIRLTQADLRSLQSVRAILDVLRTNGRLNGV